MDLAEGRESFVLLRSSQGVEMRGTVQRLTRYAIFFEIYNAGGVLQTSEILSEFKIIIHDRPVYVGKAVVKSLLHTGMVLVCEATLEDSWRDVDLLSIRTAGQVQAQFREFMNGWQKFYRVRPRYKLVIADMQSFLTDLRLWLDQVELGVRSLPSGDREQHEQDLVAELAGTILPLINGLFEKFETISNEIDPELVPVHRTYMKRQLHSLVLCSPFAYRTFQKPLGYAGDYEMVNMMLRKGYEGSSLYAKLVNLWFLEQAPALAHRNRIDYLVQKLLEETVRVAMAGRDIRIFNVGCGPCQEVQRFLGEREISNRARFKLLDFNDETLRYAQAQLEEKKREHHRTTRIDFWKKSVHALLKDGSKHVPRPPEEQYDMIYCAGLFDYLTDQVCQRIMEILYRWLAPGGLLLATNVDTSNPMRHGMEHLLDWHLIYRNARQAEAVLPSAAEPECSSVKADLTGVNLFMEARKPGHA